MAAAQQFDLSGGHPALDFVNTLDDRFIEDGPVELMNSYDDLLRFVRQLNLLNAGEAKLLGNVNSATGERALRSALELREALAAFFYGVVEGANPETIRSPSPQAIRTPLRTIERHVAVAAQHQILSWNKSKLAWGWSSSEREAELPVWILAISAVGLITTAAMERVSTCNAETCRWLFLDTSKNHTRRWCNMKVCGNRMKARRFQARQQE